MSQRASERTPGNDSSLLRGIFRRRRDKTDTDSPSVCPSVRPSARGVVPVRRDVVFVHHAWTIPDALCDAAGQPPSFAHRLLVRPQVALKIMNQSH